MDALFFNSGCYPSFIYFFTVDVFFNSKTVAEYS